uniref:Uncharacterized protein n=1 Tax=Fagus sylvatica TaxID=28930 RepID=A0A2N9G303_FAGSY
MPSRTLDHNTTKRTTACQASRLDKHEEASSSAKSAPLGMKTQATSLESIHRRDNMFNPLDDFQHFAAGGHRRPPPPVVVVVVPITLTTHPLNTCKLACGMHMREGGPAEAMPRHGLARPRHVMPRQCHGYQGMGCQGMCCQGMCCQGMPRPRHMCCQGMPRPRHATAKAAWARHSQGMHAKAMPRHATAKAGKAQAKACIMPRAAKARQGKLPRKGHARLPRPAAKACCHGMQRPMPMGCLRNAAAKAMAKAWARRPGMGCQQLERNPQL